MMRSPAEPALGRRRFARVAFARVVLASIVMAGMVTASGPFLPQLQAVAAEAPLTPAGDWLAEDIRGRGVVDRMQTTLSIAADGTVSGSGGCNHYTGTATIAGARISFGPLATTRMACTPAVMEQEQKFFSALTVVRAFRVDPATRKLFLLDLTGTPVVRFSGL